MATGIRTFFRSFLGGNSERIEISSAEYAEEIESAAIEAYALTTVIDLIVKMLASCELKVFDNNKPVKNMTWYRLNVQPNRNQTASEFWSEVWKKLIFFGEVLIVPRYNSELIIADSFTKTPYVAYDTVFDNIDREGFDLGRKDMSEVFYLSYQNPQAKIALSAVLKNYSKLINNTGDAVINDSGIKGTLNITQQAQANKLDFEEKFKDLMNNYFRSWFKNKNAVLPLWGGMTFTPSQVKGNATTSRVSEYQALFSDAVRRTAAAFGVAPALLTGEVAGIDEALSFTLTSCISPNAEALSTMLTAKNFSMNDVLKGCRIVADVSTIEHTSIFRIAQSLDKLIASGMYSVDELREKVGDYAFNVDWSSEHWMTKNYDSIETVLRGEGGDNYD